MYFIIIYYLGMEYHKTWGQDFLFVFVFVFLLVFFFM